MIEYAKAHACGNDFLVVESGVGMDTARAQRSDEAERALAIALCARTTGVGADGVEFLEWTGERAGIIRLRNADGGIAEISGNGTRCVAAWMARKSDAPEGSSFTLSTDAGPRTCTLVSRNGSNALFRTSMGVPTAEWATIDLEQQRIPVAAAIVSTGNPHFVIRVEDEQFQVQGLDWQEIGRAICFHPSFPLQTNVEFIHILSPGEIALRIFERGVGPTTSSGTGTCAAATAAIVFHQCNRELLVHAPGGTQRVAWPANHEGTEQEMELTGPATVIATGSAYVDEAAL